MHALMQGYGAAMRGNLAGLTSALAQITEYANRLPHNDPLRRGIEDRLSSNEPFIAMMAPGGVGDPTLRGKGSGPIDPAMMAQLATLRSMAERPGMSDEERAMRLSMLGNAEMALADTSPST